MPQLPLIDPDNADDEAREALTLAHRTFGITPNIAKAMANSPAAMRGYLVLADALGRSDMTAATRARIGLLVAQENRCDYGLSAHSFLGVRTAGLTEAEVGDARSGTAAEPRDAAVLALTAALVRRRGAVTDEELRVARGALTPTDIVDVIAQVALAIFDNYLVLAGRVDVDWPLVRHTDHPIA
ncbi:carboxymuconolactone decarboxylase family protein [Nocardia sp. NPDC052566]|uniref:carboxymuconolactone decarboxylase family protein n=1 Tax=Nocardia sp. NPDC052566 TaxID=3364330 RepID=UPI0037C5BC91